MTLFDDKLCDNSSHAVIKHRLLLVSVHSFPRSANACMGPLFRFIGQAIGVALLHVYTGFTKPCHMQ